MDPNPSNSRFTSNSAFIDRNRPVPIKRNTQRLDHNHNSDSISRAPSPGLHGVAGPSTTRPESIQEEASRPQKRRLRASPIPRTSSPEDSGVQPPSEGERGHSNVLARNERAVQRDGLAATQSTWRYLMSRQEMEVSTPPQTGLNQGHFQGYGPRIPRQRALSDSTVDLVMFVEDSKAGIKESVLAALDDEDEDEDEDDVPRSRKRPWIDPPLESGVDVVEAAPGSPETALNELDSLLEVDDDEMETVNPEHGSASAPSEGFVARPGEHRNLSSMRKRRRNPASCGSAESIVGTDNLDEDDVPRSRKRPRIDGGPPLESEVDVEAAPESTAAAEDVRGGNGLDSLLDVDDDDELEQWVFSQMETQEDPSQRLNEGLTNQSVDMDVEGRADELQMELDTDNTSWTPEDPLASPGGRRSWSCMRNPRLSPVSSGSIESFEGTDSLDDERRPRAGPSRHSDEAGFREALLSLGSRITLARALAVSGAPLTEARSPAVASPVNVASTCEADSALFARISLSDRGPPPEAGTSQELLVKREPLSDEERAALPAALRESTKTDADHAARARVRRKRSGLVRRRISARPNTPHVPVPAGGDSSDDELGPAMPGHSAIDKDEEARLLDSPEPEETQQPFNHNQDHLIEETAADPPSGEASASPSIDSRFSRGPSPDPIPAKRARMSADVSSSQNDDNNRSKGDSPSEETRTVPQAEERSLVTSTTTPDSAVPSTSSSMVERSPVQPLSSGQGEGLSPANFQAHRSNDNRPGFRLENASPLIRSRAEPKQAVPRNFTPVSSIMKLMQERRARENSAAKGACTSRLPPRVDQLQLDPVDVAVAVHISLDKPSSHSIATVDIAESEASGVVSTIYQIPTYKDAVEVSVQPVPVRPSKESIVEVCTAESVTSEVISAIYHQIPPAEDFFEDVQSTVTRVDLDTDAHVVSTSLQLSLANPSDDCHADVTVAETVTSVASFSTRIQPTSDDSCENMESAVASPEMDPAPAAKMVLDTSSLQVTSERPSNGSIAEPDATLSTGIQMCKADPDVQSAVSRHELDHAVEALPRNDPSINMSTAPTHSTGEIPALISGPPSVSTQEAIEHETQHHILTCVGEMSTAEESTNNHSTPANRDQTTLTSPEDDWLAPPSSVLNNGNHTTILDPMRDLLFEPLGDWSCLFGSDVQGNENRTETWNADMAGPSTAQTINGTLCTSQDAAFRVAATGDALTSPEDPRATDSGTPNPGVRNLSTSSTEDESVYNDEGPPRLLLQPQIFLYNDTENVLFEQASARVDDAASTTDPPNPEVLQTGGPTPSGIDNGDLVIVIKGGLLSQAATSSDISADVLAQVIAQSVNPLDTDGIAADKAPALERASLLNPQNVTVYGVNNGVAEIIARDQQIQQGNRDQPGQSGQSPASIAATPVCESPQPAVQNRRAFVFTANECVLTVAVSSPSRPARIATPVAPPIRPRTVAVDTTPPSSVCIASPASTSPVRQAVQRAPSPCIDRRVAADASTSPSSVGHTVLPVLSACIDTRMNRDAITSPSTINQAVQRVPLPYIDNRWGINVLPGPSTTTAVPDQTPRTVVGRSAPPTMPSVSEILQRLGLGPQRVPLPQPVWNMMDPPSMVPIQSLIPPRTRRPNLSALFPPIVPSAPQTMPPPFPAAVPQPQVQLQPSALPTRAPTPARPDPQPGPSRQPTAVPGNPGLARSGTLRSSLAALDPTFSTVQTFSGASCRVHLWLQSNRAPVPNFTSLTDKEMAKARSRVRLIRAAFRTRHPTCTGCAQVNHRLPPAVDKVCAQLVLNQEPPRTCMMLIWFLLFKDLVFQLDTLQTINNSSPEHRAAVEAVMQTMFLIHRLREGSHLLEYRHMFRQVLSTCDIPADMMQTFNTSMVCIHNFAVRRPRPNQRRRRV